MQGSEGGQNQGGGDVGTCEAMVTPKPKSDRVKQARAHEISVKEKFPSR
jgi:hypothetical protein